MYTVIKGEKIGGKIGFPTINLEPAELDTDFGVYACTVVFAKGEKNNGVLHYGKRETTDQKITLEVHLFDFAEEVYGEKVEIEIGEKIREIRAFPNLAELKKQIEKDVKQAQKILN